jgi:hypothetical protein
MSIPDSPARSANRCEILIGRSLALCAHPIAAWRVGSIRARSIVVGSYFVASYALVFGALSLLAAPPPL